MPFRMEQVSNKPKIRPVVSNTKLAGHERLLIKAVELGAKPDMNTVVVYGRGHTRGMNSLVQKAVEKEKPIDGEKTGIVKPVTGVGFHDLVIATTPIVLLQSTIEGRVDISGDISSVGFRTHGREAAEVGYIPREITPNRYGEANDAKVTGGAMMAAMVQGEENPHRATFTINLNNGETTFHDIERHLALFVSSDDAFNTGMAVFFGNFRNISISDTNKPERFGGKKQEDIDGGGEPKLFGPSTKEPLPAVITIGIRFDNRRGEKLTTVNSVVVMEHKGKLYGGNIKGANSVGPLNHGVLFVDQN
ncbi:MAG: hypothetical protein ABIG39_01365 [Candidatus Micrarchaeota archaeon]